MAPEMRAQLRAKFGKGRLLVRMGRTLKLQARTGQPDTVRAIVSVFERPRPYYHFVLCAYEPQTSREWEVLADSIDLFRLFTDKSMAQSQPLDLANPKTQEKLAGVLVVCVELQERDGELCLVVSPTAVRDKMQM